MATTISALELDARDIGIARDGRAVTRAGGLVPHPRPPRKGRAIAYGLERAAHPHPTSP